MSKGLLWNSRRQSYKKTNGNRKSLRIEPLEPRIVLSGVNGVELGVTPMPPEWAVVPYAISPTAINMTVTASHDPNQVEYYFQCTTDSSQDSGWQSSTTYAAWNLSPETEYTFQAKVREKDTTNESPYSNPASATTTKLSDDAIAKMTTAVENITNQIRAIETFTNPNNPGRITGQLQANRFPDPTVANTPEANPPKTDGLAAYPLDGRNTPGAFQVDIANFTVKDAGTTPTTTDYFERFGEWKGVATWPKNSTLNDTQIAFSAATLEEYFDILVNENGLITSISAPSASVFLHDYSIADSDTWNPTSNQLIGLHIDGFQQEQLSLYLAGREATDATVGLTDPRTCPESVMAMSLAMQTQTSKDYIWGAYRDALNNWKYGQAYRNAFSLFGSTLHITSSSTAFGVQKNEVFYCHVNAAFIIGGMYVSGAGNMNSLLEALIQADQTGYGTWKVNSQDPSQDVHFKKVADGPTAADKIFTVDKTPINVDETFPSIFHYGAALSPYGVINQGSGLLTSALMVSVADAYADSWGYEGRNVNDGLGYTRMTTETVSGTTALTDGGIYVYSNLESGGTLTLSGSGTYIINATEYCTITSEGYTASQCNNAQRVPSGRKIDISDFIANGYLTASAQDIYNSSFYVWWGADGRHVESVGSTSVPENQEMSFYFVPSAKDQADPAQYVRDNIDKTWDTTNPVYHSARITVANANVLGWKVSAAEWANNFVTFSTGTGVIDASAATGNVFIIADKSIQTIKLGSGATTVLAAPGLTSEKTFVLNADTTNTPTIDLRKGDTIDWSNLPSGLTWEGGDALTFDCTTTAQPYRRYSYTASWTGVDGSTTGGAFEAIVQANQNTGEYDPVTIVETALGVSTSVAAAAGPTISKVVVAEAFAGSNRDGVMEETDRLVTTWKLTGNSAVTYTSVNIDGTDYAAHASGNTGNYYASLGTLAAGTYTYTITATNADGTTTSTGAFTVAAASATAAAVGPTISKVVVAEAVSGSDKDGVKEETDRLLMTWNLAGGSAVKSTSVVIDGANYTGRAVGKTGNYYVPIGEFAAGTYTYKISATDAVGTATSTGTFTVAAAAAVAGPTISNVVVAEAFSGSNKNGVKETTDRLLVTWQASSNHGIASKTLTVEGQSINVGGAADPGYYGSFGPMTAGDYGYTITVTDYNGLSESHSGTFTVSSALTLETSVAADASAEDVNDSDLADIVAAAIERLEEAYGEAVGMVLDGVTFAVTDLPGDLLGLTTGNTIQIDVDAAGRGWFVDLTPDADEEFANLDDDTLMALAGDNSSGRADLLTAVMHEMGHVLGFDHADGGLMEETLSLGVRQLPYESDALDHVFASLED